MKEEATARVINLLTPTPTHDIPALTPLPPNLNIDWGLTPSSSTLASEKPRNEPK